MNMDGIQDIEIPSIKIPSIDIQEIEHLYIRPDPPQRQRQPPTDSLQAFEHLPATSRNYLLNDPYLYNQRTYIDAVFPLNPKPYPLTHVLALSLFPCPIPEHAYIVITSETLFHPSSVSQPHDTGNMHSHYCDSGPKTVFEVIDVREEKNGAVYHLGTFWPEGVVFDVDQCVVQAVDVERRMFYSRGHVAGYLIDFAVEKLVQQGLITGLKKFKAVLLQESSWIVEFEGLIGRENKMMKVQINRIVDEFVRANGKIEGFVEKGDENQYANLPRREDRRCLYVEGIGETPFEGTYVSRTGMVGRVRVLEIHVHKKRGVTRIWYGIQADTPH